MSKETAMAALTGIPVTAPVVESPVPETPKDLPSTPFSHLAKKEAEIVQMRQELKKDQELMASEKEQLKKIKTRYDEYETTKAKDPVAALKLLGFNEADILNYLANQQPVELTPEQKAAEAGEKAAEARIKTFEEAQAKKLEDDQRRADQAVIQTFKQDISKSISANAEQYEFCNHYGPAAEELVFETVQQIILDSQGKDIISTKEAIEMVEAYYEEDDKAKSKFKKRNPIQEGVEPMAEPERSRKITPGFPNEPQPKPVITKTRTLHSGATSTVAGVRSLRNENKEQKRERLMEALRNGMKP